MTCTRPFYTVSKLKKILLKRLSITISQSQNFFPYGKFCFSFYYGRYLVQVIVRCLSTKSSLVENIWKSYIWTADKDVNESDPRSNVHYLGSGEKNSGLYGPVRSGLNFFQALFSPLPK